MIIYATVSYRIIVYTHVRQCMMCVNVLLLIIICANL